MKFTDCRALVAALAAIVISTSAAAQPAQTGTLSGSVKDAQGGVLPGVAVEAVSEERGFARHTSTDATGQYRFPSLPIGSYTIVARLSGFNDRAVPNNLVETEKTTSVSIGLSLQGQSESIDVIGDVPIVDVTNVSANTRLRREEFDKVPVGRSYQQLMGQIPGVVGTGNLNSSGALSTNNLFLMDGVDTTDPTTGGFGANLNFETVEEVSSYTSAVSVEYGRAVGAVVNIVTKSGTNRYEGSARYVVSNDQWDAQNTTKSEFNGASLARTKFDKMNPRYVLTLGGPILKDRAWFFGSYERANVTSPQRQTVGPTPENYQQTTTDNYLNLRATTQLNQSNMVWLKFFRSPTNGFVTDYWGASGERAALTSQSQTSHSWAGQWSSVLSSSWTMEATAGTYGSRIDVGTFEDGRHSSNAPHFNLADGRYYNGATFDGNVERPRQQGSVALTHFRTLGGRSHSFKAGVDYQRMESRAEFRYPGNQLYIDSSYNQATGAFAPFSRRDYEAGPSISQGSVFAAYLRDKFQVSSRLFVEAGLRFEKQSGESDLGAGTVNSPSLSPRVSMSFDIEGDGKTLAVFSLSRYYTGILQSLSDSFAGVPQQANYKDFTWNGSTYVQTGEVRVGASAFRPNLDVRNPRTDEITLGAQRQFGRSMGAGVRFIARNWSNLLDDTRAFNSDLTVNREVTNSDLGERQYRGVHFTFEKRFSGNWNAQASYTFSKTQGNHFADNFSGLGDYVDEMCRTTVDTTIGSNGIIDCATVQEGENKYGSPSYDRPHNLKLTGAYVRKIGPINLTTGVAANAISKQTYTRQRTVNVLRPGSTTVNAGPTATYYYEPFGSTRLEGLTWSADLNIEASHRINDRSALGIRGEAFNVTNNQEKIATADQTWCGTTATATCATAVQRFGLATARGHFRSPRTVRFQLFARF